MKVTIDEDACISCEACVEACGDVFEMVDEKAKVKEGADLNGNADAVKEAAESCPVECITVEE